MIATNELRWVQRYFGQTLLEKVLQQKWVAVVYNDNYTQMKELDCFEWRDVPTVSQSV
jgi:hypothetical protein